MERGEMIGLSFERAMEYNSIGIPIFSESYAKLPWSLKEAAAMVRTPNSIIPLFYYVDQTHVRYPQNDTQEKRLMSASMPFYKSLITQVGPWT
ncbi:hypothetical protein SUGI_0249260 [Cryptomeria japonica]|nr:hypothetical protein SUGI_0249260 [Cryptomeria japonica]